MSSEICTRVALCRMFETDQICKKAGAKTNPAIFSLVSECFSYQANPETSVETKSLESLWGLADVLSPWKLCFFSLRKLKIKSKVKDLSWSNWTWSLFLSVVSSISQAFSFWRQEGQCGRHWWLNAQSTFNGVGLSRTLDAFMRGWAPLLACVTFSLIPAACASQKVILSISANSDLSANFIHSSVLTQFARFGVQWEIKLTPMCISHWTGNIGARSAEPCNWPLIMCVEYQWYFMQGVLKRSWAKLRTCTGTQLLVSVYNAPIEPSLLLCLQTLYNSTYV